MSSQYCLYYQAVTNRPKTWFVNGCLRNEPNVCLERCLDKTKNLFEFFVPADQEQAFLEITDQLLEGGYLLSRTKMPNRMLPAR